jgi:integrase
MRQRTSTRHVIVRPADAQTRNKYRDFCSAALNYAVRDGWIERNPMQDVARASLRSRRLHVLRREDFYDNAEVAALLGQVADLHERCFYELGFDAGLRLPGEGLGLTWGETDFDAGVIRPYNNFIDGVIGDPKTLAPIGIPMTPRLRADLREIQSRGQLVGPKDPVFIDENGRVLPEKKLRRRFAEAASRAALKTIPMYNARHSFGTALARSGKVDIRTIQQLMRHSHIATTQQYMAYAPQPDLAERMAEALAPPHDAARSRTVA